MTNPAPVASATCTNCFTVTARPNPTSTNPSSRGRGATNQNVNLAGTGFQSGATVAFSGTGITVNNVAFSSSTLLVVNLSVSGSATLGARNVTVTNLDGGTGTLNNGFTVNTGPGLTSLSPSSRAQGQSNQSITFNGSNFGGANGPFGGSVAFSGTGITVNSVTRTSSNTLTVNISVSGGAAATARDVTVTNPDGGSVTLNNGFTVTATAPFISSLTPSSRGRGAANQNINFAGTGFQSGATVAFSGTGITVNTVTFNSSTLLVVNLSISGSATLSSRNVTVTNPGGASATLNNGFTVNAAPGISSLSPNSKRRGTGAQNITLTGSNFPSNFVSGGGSVGFSGNGINIISVTRNSSTSLTVRLSVSNFASLGFRNVMVTNPDRGAATINNGFRITT